LGSFSETPRGSPWRFSLRREAEGAGGAGEAREAGEAGGSWGR